MFWEILIALILGIGIGIITGLVPGIHVNLVAVLLISSAAILLEITTPLVLCVFIISLALTHTFLDALPSIYLGAPDEAQALNVLPGHRMLLQGEGHQAVLYTVIGSLGALLLGLMLFPFFIWSMKIIQPTLAEIIGYVLIFVVLFLLWREKQKIKSLALFLLSGALGIIVLTGLPQLKQPLFPLLSGLFGVSTLITSLLQSSVIPQQQPEKPLRLSKKNGIKAISAATGMGFIAAFLPGFGSSQAAIVATMIVGNIGDEGFITLVGGINTAGMLISIATIYALDKARNGAIVAVSELLGKVGIEEMILFLAVALVVGGIAAALTIFLSKSFASVISKVNYTIVIWIVICFTIGLVFFFDSFTGFMILLTSTALGLLAAIWGVGKNNLLGCLLLPVILFFVL